MTTVASRTFTQACADAAVLLNDAAQDTYTTALLMPFAALVYLELAQEFEVNEVPIGEALVTLDDYVANAVTIPANVSAAPLTDFGEPIEIWQRAAASPNSWDPIARVSRLPAPPVNAPTEIEEWEWSEGAIKVNPCSEARDIRCRYRKSMAYPTAALAVGIEDFYLPLVYGTAQKAAGPTGRERLRQIHGSDYEEQREKAIIQAVKGTQGIRRTKAGYRSR